MYEARKMNASFIHSRKITTFIIVVKVSVNDSLIDSDRTSIADLLSYHRLSDAVSSNGLSFSAIASRARKILLRTVPIGQCIASAISS